MTLPNLISFSGFASSGKDAAADLLVQRARFVKTHMTKHVELALVRLDPVIVDSKEGTLERFAHLYEMLGDLTFKDYDEARRLLKTMEIEIGREGGNNVWLDLLLDEILTYRLAERKIALSGVRYPEELAFVREHEGVCVWIDRPQKAYRGDLTIRAEDCDVVVQNKGTLRELYINLVTALEEYNSTKETDNVG